MDIQERHPPTSLNMVVCLNNKDLNQPDRWLTNSQANSKVNKDTLFLQLNPLANMLTSKWVMGVLLALVAMVVVLSSLKTPSSGVLPLPKISKTALVVTKADFFFSCGPGSHLCECIFSSIMRGFFAERDINLGALFS